MQLSARMSKDKFIQKKQIKKVSF